MENEWKSFEIIGHTSYPSTIYHKDMTDFSFQNIVSYRQELKDLNSENQKVFS